MKTEYGWIVAIGILVVGVFLYDPSPQKEDRGRDKEKIEDVEEEEVVELSKNGKLARKTADALLAGYIDVYKTIKSEGIEEGEDFTKRMSELTSEMLVEVFDPLDEAAQALEENYTTSKGKKFCSDLISGFQAVRSQEVKATKDIIIRPRPRPIWRGEEVCNCSSLDITSSTGHGKCICADGACKCDDCLCRTCSGKGK